MKITENNDFYYLNNATISLKEIQKQLVISVSLSPIEIDKLRRYLYQSDNGKQSFVLTCFRKNEKTTIRITFADPYRQENIIQALNKFFSFNLYGNGRDVLQKLLISMNAFSGNTGMKSFT